MLQVLKTILSDANGTYYILATYYKQKNLLCLKAELYFDITLKC